jgi:uncharacterized cupredoxin-like copper-binding protein
MFRYLAVSLLLLCGCHVAGKSAPAAVSAATPLRIVTVDYAFDSIADTVASGNRMVTIVNHGHQAHMVALYRLDPGHTVDEFLHEVRARRTPGWAVDHGGPNLTLPGDSTTMEMALPAGTYAITCWVLDSAGAPHIMIGMLKGLDVAPRSAVDEPDPITDDTVRLASYHLLPSHPLVAGPHVLRVENIDSGTITHDLMIMRITPGHTLDEALDWLDTMRGTTTAFETAGSVSGIEPGGHVALFANLSPGNYALLCLMPDHADGKRHYRHGMVSPFTVN